MRARHLIALTVVPLAFVACGDDDDDDDDDAASTVAVATAAPDSVAAGGGTITVIATDYKFAGLPASAPAGAQLALQNDSDKEVHEMVIFRIPDEVTETVGQILALPEEEQTALVGEAPPVGVIVALPGEVGQVVEGGNTLDEPGRYAVLCFIPKGADPEVVREAMSAPPPTGDAEGEQPPLGDGPPHIMEGMYAEITIE
jgi:hypothetical protein